MCVHDDTAAGSDLDISRHALSANGVSQRYVGGLVRYPSQAEQVSSLPVDQPRRISAKTKARVLLGVPESSSLAVYRGTLLELVGTTLLVYAHIGLVRSSVASYFVPHWAPLIIAVTNGALLCLFIIALAAPSGGHVNPTITMATMCTGHTSVFRGLLYLTAQSVASIVGSVLMRATLGWDDVTAQDLAVCSFGSLTEEGALVAEIMFSFVLLLIAYGVAFDPKQGQLFGPILAPVFISAAVALLLFAGAGLSTTPGYAPGMNWAMCLGPAVAAGERVSMVHFVGPLIACVLHAFLFIAAPPHHAVDGCFVPPMLLELEQQKRRL